MTRTVPGLMLAAGWLLLLLKGGSVLFWIVVVALGFIGSLEYVRMAVGTTLSTAARILMAMIMVLPVCVIGFTDHSAFPAAFGLILSFFFLSCFTLCQYRHFENPLVLLSRGSLGLVFIGFCCSHLVAIRNSGDGMYWLVILSGITSGSDSFAYWLGCRWGKKKLCPTISPNKTVVGAAGGLCGGVAVAVILWWLLDMSTGLGYIVLVAFCLSIVGMIGDLIESIIKRGTGTKDSGTLLAGHGGVFDRIDSLLLTAPFLYYFLICTGV